MQPLHVLIVDDEPTARTIVRNMLSHEQISMEIHETDSAKGALCLIQKEQIDVVLLDISMPEMSGLELLRILHEQYPDIQVIMLTMYQDFSYAIESMRNGALDYLLKDGSEKNRLHENLRKILIRRQRAAEYSTLQDEKNLALKIQQRLWFEQSGRIAVFSPCGETPLFPLVEQERRLMSMGIFDSVIPIERDYWFVSTAASEKALRQALTESAAEVIISQKLKLTNENPTVYADNIAAEHFYFEGSSVVSGIEYSRGIPGNLQSRFSEEFLHFMMGQHETFLSELAAQCIEDHVAPRSLKSFLRNCVQDWCGAQKEAGVTLEQIENAPNWNSVRMALSAFSLQEQLDSKSDENVVILRLKQYIRSNLGGDLSLHTLAKRAGYAPAYLSALFKQQCGTGLKRFIIDARLAGAAEALRETDQRIHEIANSVGFRDTRYFSELFLKAYHVTPQDYRKKMTHG